jgi:antitoxin YefM
MSEMNSINVDTFEQTWEDCIKTVINNHNPLKVIGNNGEDFVIISAEDWEREQETLSILQNNDLMKQIANSLQTHLNNKSDIL